jgi:hypothetical protein
MPLGVEEVVESLRSASSSDALPYARRLVSALLESTPAGAWHPYGFLVLRLAELPSHEVIRLHIWPADARKRQEPDWPVHSHPWDLRSYVLAGHLQNQLFDVSSTVSGEFRLYAVEYAGQESILRATDRMVGCQLASVASYEQGDQYCVSSDEFHVTHVDPGVFAATLVVTSRPTATPPSVVGQPGHDESYRYIRRPCSPDVARGLVSSLASSIGT